MPSLINELALTELKGAVEEAPALILVDASGLKAEESLALRKGLSEAGANMRQAKARLLAKAVPEDVAAHLSGQGGSLAMVSGEDIAAAAKLLNDLVKDEKVTVRAGMVEGRAVDASGAARFADLPTKHEARAMVARASSRARAPSGVTRKCLVARPPRRAVGGATHDSTNSRSSSRPKVA